MKQVVSHLDSGEVELIDVPRPRPGPGELLIESRYSVVSSGTERMLVSFGAASWAGKALQQPERLRQVWDKARNDGLSPTVQAVQARLSAPIPLGYSSVGVVLEVGAGVDDFVPGDRVAAAAPHAELSIVAARLAAKVPEAVSSRDAAFTTVAAVALNALRGADVAVGGVVAVIGLGLLGQLALRLATSAGCHAVGFDVDPSRSAFADHDAFAQRLQHVSRGVGADAVIVTADADRDTLQRAATLARKGGAVVLVGAGDPTLDRRLFYERELRFSVAHAYGAGRDEPAWERGAVDYPPHRVRWTAQRNFDAVLDLLATRQLTLDGLDVEEVDFADAPVAYDRLRTGAAPPATVFRYGAASHDDVIALPNAPQPRAGALSVAVIGAGNFATRVLLPCLAEHDVVRTQIASRGGLSAAQAAREFRFARATTNLEEIFDDGATDVVFIASAHEAHVDHAVAALAAGKHVWLEKPVAIDRAGLDRLAAAAAAASTVLMVGFNRRFSATLRELYAQTRDVGPRTMVYTVHAPPLPADHWLLDRALGGGRLVGEACHFVDALRYLADAPIIRSRALLDGDGGTMMFRFADGSVGTVHYITTGHASLPKERLELSAGGRSWTLHNARALRVAGEFAPARRLRDLAAPQDKGHAAAIDAFLQAVRARRADPTAPSPIPFEESLDVTRAIFDALDPECFT